MNEIMKFEDMPIDIQNIDGVWMFELYSVGAAIGQVKKNSSGVIYPRKDRIDENVKKAEIQPCVRNGHKYITESQLYDLMLEARTDKCRVFRKWLTNEVLPALNHKGTYSVSDHRTPRLIPETVNEYFDKTWKGKPVMSVKDVAQCLGVSVDTVRTHLKRSEFVHRQHYLLLEGEELSKFKEENPKVERNCKRMTIVYSIGFRELCKQFGVEVEIPDWFVDGQEKIPEIVNRILNNFGFEKRALNDLNRERADYFVGEGKSITGQCILCTDKVMYIDREAGKYEKAEMLMTNLGRYLFGELRESIDGYPVHEYDIRLESKLFASVFTALIVFSEYGGFDKK